MTKKYLKELVRKVNMLPILLMAVMSVGLASCGDDEKEKDEIVKPDDRVMPVTDVTITNSSVITLQRFRVVFLNSRGETLTDKDYGTLAPNDYITAKIPTGATQYYMATYLSSTWFFSANYDISITSMRLTDAEVGEWRSNSSTRSVFLRDAE
jgi:hypothetical protein